MGTIWTSEQKQVIDSRNENLLVSAAAGSGKTAVLVERILSLITDRDHPTDIDRLLVVTFTRAAAAEMRDRVGRALENRLEEDPDNIHLQRQSALLQHAHISTIHSFCTSVIRNYCHRIELDPGYRIADEGELRMLQGKVMAEFLEEQYGARREAFLHFADAYAPGRDDRKIEELIQDVSDFASSDPDPDAWLDACVRNYQADSADELQEKPWMRFLLDETERILTGAEQLAEQNLGLAEGPGGPGTWLNSLREDLTNVRMLRKQHTFGTLAKSFAALSFSKLSPKKTEEEEPDLRSRVKDGRDSLKKMLTGLQQSFFTQTEEEVLAELRDLKPYAEELARLAKEYRAAFAAAKRKKNICDYDDLEHFALEILLEKDEDGTLRPSQAARETALQFDEIMIDEYQDSNYIQEALLGAVAGAGCGKRNRFMVGDIKQSIYGFRNARPDLFLEKYNSYSGSPETGRRIDLQKNFRSRPQVLDSVNRLFRQIMKEELGGIAYDDDAALYPGAAYPDPPVSGAAEKNPDASGETTAEENFDASGETTAEENVDASGQTAAETNPDASGSYVTEVILTETAPESDDGPVLRQKQERIEAEARAAAGRLRELMGTMQVYDRETGVMRPVRYRDCVILLRSAAGWADTYVQVLKEEGIPAYTLSREGYFSAPEVVTVLDCLRVTDNPRWDIPLAAVLRSPVTGCSDAEMARIRTACPDQPLYDAVCSLAAENEKLGRILRLLENWREEAPVMAVHELIRKILEDTGFGEYASSMPGGAQRQANLRMLVEKAAAYEKTGDSGLFNFIRYIERMQKYSVDDGEVSLYSETEDIVRVTTIHKSKGLEYPVVIVSGLGKQFNRQDQNSPVILHPLFGAGLYAVDRELRVRRPSLLRQVIRTVCSRDMLSEELRILYVAMTRAKEKLILTGTVKNTEQMLPVSEVSGYQQLAGAHCPLDWILQAGDFMRHVQAGIARPAEDVREEVFRNTDIAARLAVLRAEIQMSLSGMREAEKAPDLPEKEAERSADSRAGITEFLEKKENFRYPYAEAAELPAKMTVTEIKKASIEAMQEESGERLYPEEEVIPYIPAFMKDSAGAEAAGAARGTIYHHVLELLDYHSLAAEEEEEAIRTQLSKMAEKGQLKAGEVDIVDPADILAFLHSSIGSRMREAALAGRLWRERPFVLDIPAKEIDKNWPEGENILVQGVIDAWFEEEDGYVLVDYKTDRVFSPDGHELREKYAPQLALYSRAIETITGIPVKEMYLYSVTLGREIPV